MSEQTLIKEYQKAIDACLATVDDLLSAKDRGSDCRLVLVGLDEAANDRPVEIVNFQDYARVEKIVDQFDYKDGWVSYQSHVLMLVDARKPVNPDGEYLLHGEFVDHDGKVSLHIQQDNDRWLVRWCTELGKFDDSNCVIRRDRTLAIDKGQCACYAEYLKIGEFGCQPIDYRFLGFFEATTGQA